MSTKSESIKHWEIMIEWVEAQNKDAFPEPFLMRERIEIYWGAEYCPYCIKYYVMYDSCPNCPISKSGNRCEADNSIWRRVNKSQTWGEWLVHANDMLSLLESLSEEE